jgi:hypothetical protein
MVRWLIFCAVVGRPGCMNFMQNWEEFYQIMKESKKKKWGYERLLKEYEKVADKYFDTARFEEFCDESLHDLDEQALEYFSSDDFERIITEEVNRYFKIPHERPEKLAHYRGIHNFWIHCEEKRLKECAAAKK